MTIIVPESASYLAGILATFPEASTDHVCCDFWVGTLTFTLSHNRDTHFLKHVSEVT